MSNHSRRLKALDSNDVSVAAYTIREFCARHRMSVSFYYTLPSEMRPREMRVGKKKVLITSEADAEWRQRTDVQAEEGA